MMSLKRVLIVGGTGYLGQHLLQSLGISYEAHPPLSLAFTHNTEPPPQLLLNALPHVLPFHVDMRTGDGLDAISNLFGQVFNFVNRPTIYQFWVSDASGSLFGYVISLVAGEWFPKIEAFLEVGALWLFSFLLSFFFKFSPAVYDLADICWAAFPVLIILNGEKYSLYPTLSE